MTLYAWLIFDVHQSKAGADVDFVKVVISIVKFI